MGAIADKARAVYAKKAPGVSGEPDKDQIYQLFDLVDQAVSVVNVKSYGAKGDGVTDDTAAINAAHATGAVVFYPYGDYKYVGYFPACEGGIVGEGWSTNNGSKRARIVFYNCTNPLKAAITPKKTQPFSRFFTIHNIVIRASSWSATTGCLGRGLDIAVPVDIKRVLVQGFRKDGAYLHHDAPLSDAAPYASTIDQLRAEYNGGHGIIIGPGANALTLTEPECKWNGAPSYMTAPTTAGSGDGLVMTQSCPDGVYAQYQPEAVTITGGDCSYNARYGWSILTPARCDALNLGYSEGNKGSHNINIGNMYRSTVRIAAVNGDEASVRTADASYSIYHPHVAVFIGPKKIWPLINWALALDPGNYEFDEANEIWTAAPKGVTHVLSRSDDTNYQVRMIGNRTPDNVYINTASGTAVSFTLVAGNSYIGIGAGSRHLKIGVNQVRLPDLYYMATDLGWGAGMVSRSIGPAAPSAGTWRRGDIQYNSEPSPGGYVGWVCTAAGTPGTWKGFGGIAA